MGGWGVREGREEGGHEERASGKADTRRDAAQKFYCRSLRGFHLQIPWGFPFLSRGRVEEKRNVDVATDFPAKEYIYDRYAYVHEDVRVHSVAELLGRGGCIP